MEKLELYNKVRAVPDDAKKPIKGGRLQGMTDINPMWRIKTLTENFGMCGVGWKTKIVDKWINDGGEEQVCNVMIELYVKVDGEWSDAIVGVGGSKLIAGERNGKYIDDECFKKAYTDAISVACKMLGVGADVYWDKDSDSKYYVPEQPNRQPKQTSSQMDRQMEISQLIDGVPNITMLTVDQWILKKYGNSFSLSTLDDKQYQALKDSLANARAKAYEQVRS